MDTLMQADIFFFVTTVVTIVIGILVAVILVYTVFLIRDLRHIAHTVRTGADIVADDVKYLGRALNNQGNKIKSLLDFTKKTHKKAAKTKKK